VLAVSEILVNFYQITQRYNPEDSHLIRTFRTVTFKHKYDELQWYTFHILNKPSSEEKGMPRLKTKPPLEYYRY
jgi:hypothetical protein